MQRLYAVGFAPFVSLFFEGIVVCKYVFWLVIFYKGLQNFLHLLYAWTVIELFGYDKKPAVVVYAYDML